MPPPHAVSSQALALNGVGQTPARPAQVRCCSYASAPVAWFRLLGIQVCMKTSSNLRLQMKKLKCRALAARLIIRILMMKITIFRCIQECLLHEEVCASCYAERLSSTIWFDRNLVARGWPPIYLVHRTMKAAAPGSHLHKPKNGQGRRGQVREKEGWEAYNARERCTTQSFDCLVPAHCNADFNPMHAYEYHLLQGLACSQPSATRRERNGGRGGREGEYKPIFFRHNLQMC